MTGPPSLLAPSSVVEVGQCWAQRPSIFTAPALEPCSQKRALLVLRWFLASLRSQLYIGVDHPANNSCNSPATKPASSAPSTSIRKPLNAFLGELFLATFPSPCPETNNTTHLVAEQVSHHPPITAMHVSSPEHGIRADGYARVEMTFNGSVNIRQLGHATLHIDRFDEDYLVPLPDVKVRGFLSGCMYPELGGVYTIVGSSGWVSEVRFWGEGLVRGKKNSFEARVYHQATPKQAVYEVAGCWNEGWTVKECGTGEVIEVYEVDAPENGAVPMVTEPLERQDPWESRRAWGGVLEGLRVGDMRTVVAEKSKIEEAQRRMRASEAKRGTAWEPLLFQSLLAEEHDVFHRLSKGLAWPLQQDKTKGVWRVDDDRVKKLQRPFRGSLTPFGY